jgi:chemotaxis protein methyltransferase CheR
MAEALHTPDTQLWTQAGRWVESELGLHFPPRLWPDLARGLDAAARRLDLADAAACVRHALAHGFDPREKQVLAECLAIGETYFFRDPQLFEQLAAQVLRPLIAARARRTRRVRLWSAGCSTGEEPYSLAMLVAGLLPDWREWDISILATDINLAALQKARAGVYGPWSFRGELPPYCLPFLRSDAQGRRHVDPALRRLVHFAPLNLAWADYPSPATRTTGMDLVVCRNVLIYFEPQRIAAVLARLGRALDEEGWLVTGSVELPRQGVDGLRVVHADGLFGLRRAAAPPVARAPAPLQELPLPLPRLAPAIVPSPPAATPVAEAPPSLLEQARSLADSGDRGGAERLCRAAMAQDKLDPEVPYLLASILLEAGDDVAAAATLQRTLYLDPGHVLARFALGSLLLSQGRQEAGRRQFALALEQLESVPGGEVLQGSGGLTARELQSAIRRAGTQA